MAEKKKKLEFGLQPPKSAKVAWGARAIFKPISRNPMIDILWDRQSVFGEEKDRQDLVEWVRTTGLPKLEELIDKKSSYSLTTSHEVFKFKDGDYSIQASPKGSGGYLYIVAWKG